MDLEGKIRGYYPAMDRGDLEYVFALFAPAAVYQRGQSFRLEGKPQIEGFYRDVRKLSGTHHVHRVAADGAEVRVAGSFTGTNAGRPIEINFTDRWVFGPDGLVTLRVSELDQRGV